MAFTLLIILCGPLVVLLGILLRKLVALYRQRLLLKHVLRDFPGPEPHWWHGNMRELQGDYAGLLKVATLASHYQGAFTVWTGPFSAFLMFVDPSTAKMLLAGTDPKDEFSYSLMRPWIGDGLILSQGKKWARARRLITSAFHVDLLKNYTKIFCSRTKILLDKWHLTNGQKEMFHHASLLTMDTMMSCLFGCKNDNQRREARHPYLRGVYDVTQLILKRIATPHHHIDFIYYQSEDSKRFKAACEVIHQYSRTIVEERRKLRNTEDPGSRSPDFLDILLSAKDEDGMGLTDQEIQDEVDTFMFGGHDTTASAIAWTLYHLASHQQYQDKCRHEASEVLGDTLEVTWDDISRLEFISMCITESLRLCPPVPNLSRFTLNEIQLPDRRVVPKGIRVAVSLFALHRNPDVWHEPEVFDPERFASGNISSSEYWMTFSAGPRLLS